MGQHRTGAESDVTIALFFWHHIICAELRTIVVCEHVMNEVMKKIIYHQQNCKLATNIKFLFTLDLNRVVYTNKTTIELII